MIELEDFSAFIEVKREREEGSEEREPLKELEERYRREILKLQASFKEEIERVREEAYKKGFEEGYSKGLKEKEEELKRREQELMQEFGSRLEALKLNVDSLVKSFEEEKRRRVEEVGRALLDSLFEILEFLYLNPSNVPYIKEKISQIAEEFSQEELIGVEAGEKLAQALEGEKVRVNPELGDYDFRVLFKDFAVESNFEEKLNLLREEVEREVKKTS